MLKVSRFIDQTNYMPTGFCYLKPKNENGNIPLKIRKFEFQVLHLIY